MARPQFPGGGGNMQNLMRQAQKMQQDMARVQEELEQAQVEGSAGGGAVRVVASGKKQILSVTINPEAVDPEDVEMLQDMIMAAVNEALKAAEDLAAQRMGGVTGGMSIPGLF